MTDADRPDTRTVLYVEDDPGNQELMRGVIGKRPGARLLLAGSGADALETAMAERPGLILLDRRLPDMTGDEVLHLLRGHEETNAIPVIIISGDTARPVAGATSLGVVGYLTKPIDIRELLSHIDRILDFPA